MSVNKGQLLTLAGRLTAAVNSLPPLNDIDGAPANRQAIVTLAQEVFYEATLPEEQWRIDVSVLCTMTVSRLFLKWGAFDAIPVKGAIGYDDLVEKLKVNGSLFRRLATMLVAAKILRQLGDDQLAHTPKSLVFVSSNSYSLMAQMSFDETFKACAFMPDYFDKYPEEPRGPVGSPYSFAEGHPEKSVWEIMNQDSERMRVFMGAMKALESLMPATSMYDFGWVKGELAKQPERILFVDVGGNKGHSLQAVCEANKWLPRERCMLQDRDEVIEEARLLGSPGLRGVKMMGHDFNLEQPVKGALIYHLRRCLHDYGDEIGINIIRNIADAMTSDSRLLIVELVVAVPPSPIDMDFDFVMMTVGGKERSLKQFEHMVKEAGLKILKVHKESSTAISVMECAKE